MLQTINDGIKIQEIDILLGGQGICEDEAERVFNTGIFKHTRAINFSLEYMDEQITAAQVQNGLLDFYSFRATGFATWQEFVNHFTHRYNAAMKKLYLKLKTIPEFSLVENIDTTTENVETSASGTGEETSQNKYTNTPNQYLQLADGLNGLTDLSEGKGNTQSSSEGKTERTITHTNNINPFDKWIDLTDKFSDIIHDFYIEFEELFKTTAVLYSIGD